MPTPRHKLPQRACVAHMRIRAFLIIAAVLAIPLQGTRTRTGTFGKTAIAAPRARSKGEESRATVKNAATNVLFDQSKIVSRDLHRQTDTQTGF